jgi:hypothetical protein
MTNTALFTKVNLNDITNIDYSVNNHIPQPKVERSVFVKVNLSDVKNLSRRKSQEVIKLSFDTICTNYDTNEELELITSLVKITAIRKNSQGIDYDLSQDRRFIRMNKIHQIKVVISILDMGIDVLVDGCKEVATIDNINSLNKVLVKLELNKLEKDKVVRSNMEIFTRR